MPLKFPKNGVSLDGGTTWGQDVPDATPSAAGLMSAQQAASLGGVVNAVSPIIDFTSVRTGISFLQPLKRAGFYFMASSWQCLVVTQTGTATSALAISVGNDAGQTNVVVTGSTLMSAAILNSIVGFTPIPVASGNGPQSNVLIDAATEITLKSTAVTGATACTGRLVVTGTWVPVAAP